MLILCEAKRTEPSYFNALVRSADLTSVKVEAGRGAVAHLERRLEEAGGNDSDWDEIWCVLDHDGRDRQIADFTSRVRALKTRRTRPSIRAIVSVPCFELWILLHFEFTNRPFKGATSTDSGCGEVIDRLKSKYLNNYDKADANLFRRLESLTNVAISHAKRPATSDASSSTDVWKLVERLRNLRSS